MPEHPGHERKRTLMLQAAAIFSYYYPDAHISPGTLALRLA